MLSSSYKQDIIWPDATGLDASALIPFELGGTMQPTKPSVSVMDLGKMLLHCAREGETATVRDLMGRGAPFTTDWLGTSPLHVAATNNHHDTCDILIKAGISKNARTKVDRTPLHFAVYEGHEDIVRLLLAHDCEVDAQDMLRMTPLHWAVEKRHPRLVDLLLRRGADPSVRSKFDKTPLSLALETGQTTVYEDLLVAKNRIGDPEQQQAADSLMFELSRARDGGEADGEHGDDVVEMHGDEDVVLDDEPLVASSSSDHLPDQDRLNANGMEIDESISKLAQSTGHVAASGKTSSIDKTMRILNDHGIAMLEDTNDTLLNSALQSGRRLVLSGAGKLLLNDPKFRTVPAMPTATTATIQQAISRPTTTTFAAGNMHTSPKKKTIFVPAGAGGQPIRLEAVRKPSTIFVPSKSMVGSAAGMQQVVKHSAGTHGGGAGGVRPTAALPLKTNKVIKILTAEEFKELCSAKGGTAGSTLKKISAESLPKGALKYQTISNANMMSHLARKKPLHKIKLGTLTQATKVNSSMLNELKIAGLKPMHPPPHLMQKLIHSTAVSAPSTSQHQTSAQSAIVLDPDTEYISRLSQNQAKAAAAAAAAAAAGATTTTAQPTTTTIVGMTNVQRVTIPSSSASSASFNAHQPGAARPAAAPMSQPEMERLLLDLRKQTEELRRRFELSEQQCEEYRVRLEKLERERDEERAAAALYS